MSWPEYAALYIAAGLFYPGSIRRTYDHQHADDELFFDSFQGVDPTLDYSQWSNRRHASHVQLQFCLRGDPQEVTLALAFDAITESRLQIYSAAGLIEDVTLRPGASHFLMVVESQFNNITLYFIHCAVDGSIHGDGYGGEWFFRGITGYIE